MKMYSEIRIDRDDDNRYCLKGRKGCEHLTKSLFARMACKLTQKYIYDVDICPLKGREKNV